jgi:hypothetical protein
MSERDREEELEAEGGVREDYRPAGDPAEEPREDDRDSEYEQVEEELTEARSPDPRIAEPPS